MTSFAGQYGPEPCLDSNGRLLKAAVVNVFQVGTNVNAVLYTDRTMGQSTPNPTTSDLRGNLTFFALPGQYDLVVNATRVTVTVEPDPVDTSGFSEGTVIAITPSASPTLQVQLPNGTVITSDFLSYYSPNIGDIVTLLGTRVIGTVAGAGSVVVPVNASITTPTLGVGLSFNTPGVGTSTTASNASVTTPTLGVGLTFGTPAVTVTAANPSIVQHSSAVGTLSGTTMTVSLPAGTTAGNRVVVAINDPFNLVATPAGWTMDASSSVRVGSYVLSLVNVPAGQRSWSFTTSSSATGAWAYELANATSALGSSTASHDTSSATTGASSTFTPSVAGSISIACFGVGSTTASALTSTAGATFTFDGNDMALGAAGFATGHLVLTSASNISTTLGYTAGASGAHSCDLAIACYASAVSAAGVATHTVVSAPNTATVGTPFTITVSALDANGNVATGYSGIVTFTSTDSKVTLPANSGLTNGVGTFTVTFGQAGTFTVTATDTVTGSITGTSGSVVASASSSAGNQVRVAAGLIIPENSTTLSYVDPWLTWQGTYVPSAYQGVRPPVGWLSGYMNWGVPLATAVGNVPPLLNSSGTNVKGGSGATQALPRGVLFHIPLAYVNGPTVQQVAAGAADSLLTSGGGFTGGPAAVFRAIIAQGMKVVLRLGLECDPNWASWPWTSSGPAAFIAAFREQSTFWRTQCPGVLIDWNAFSWDPTKVTASDFTTKAQAWWPGSQYVDLCSVDVYERASGAPVCTQMQTALSSCQAFAAANNKLFGVGEIDWQQNDATCVNNTFALLDGFPAPPASLPSGGTFNGGLLYWSLFQAEPNDTPGIPYGIQNYPANLAAYQTRMGKA